MNALEESEKISEEQKRTQQSKINGLEATNTAQQTEIKTLKATIERLRSLGPTPIPRPVPPLPPAPLPSGDFIFCSLRFDPAVMAAGWLLAEKLRAGGVVAHIMNGDNGDPIGEEVFEALHRLVLMRHCL